MIANDYMARKKREIFDQLCYEIAGNCLFHIYSTIVMCLINFI